MLKIAGIIKESIVDGPGIRYVIFCQGCPHHCKGCHNQETWDFSKGKWVSIDDIIKDINSNPLLTGITLSGGEPFAQTAELINLCKNLDRSKLDIWIYSGYTINQLISDNNPNQKENLELLSLCDVLIDGPFILEQRDLTLKFKGSRNQNEINLKDFFARKYQNN